MDEFDVFTSNPSPTKQIINESTNNDIFSILNDNTDSTISIQSNGLDNNDDQISPKIETESVDNSFENSNTISSPTKDILIDKKKEDNSSSYIPSNENLSIMEKILKQREQEIATKDEEERKKIEELRKQAKNDLERWYKEREKQIEQKRQTIKTQENNFDNKSNSNKTCDWSNVIHLLDFTDGKQITKSKRDLTRMKSCLFNAKRFNENKKLIMDG